VLGYRLVIRHRRCAGMFGHKSRVECRREAEWREFILIHRPLTALLLCEPIVVYSTTHMSYTTIRVCRSEAS
jgi:hypothetical protein